MSNNNGNSPVMEFTKYGVLGTLCTVLLIAFYQLHEKPLCEERVILIGTLRAIEPQMKRVADSVEAWQKNELKRIQAVSEMTAILKKTATTDEATVELMSEIAESTKVYCKEHSEKLDKILAKLNGS